MRIIVAPAMRSKFKYYQKKGSLSFSTQSAQPRRCRAFRRPSAHNPICGPSPSCDANRRFGELEIYALASRLRASWIEARATKAPRVSVRLSKSLARRRLRPNQEKVRSTTQRRGRATIRRRFPWLELIWADGGYNAWQVDAAAAKVPPLRRVKSSGRPPRPRQKAEERERIERPLRLFNSTLL